jgi:hypothetical protein
MASARTWRQAARELIPREPHSGSQVRASKATMVPSPLGLTSRPQKASISGHAVTLMPSPALLFGNGPRSCRPPPLGAVLIPNSEHPATARTSRAGG